MVRHGLLGPVDAGLDAQALHCVGDSIVSGPDRLRYVEVAGLRVVGVEGRRALALATVEGRDLAVTEAEQRAREVGIPLAREKRAPEDLKVSISIRHQKANL